MISDELQPVFAEERFSHIEEHIVPIAVFPDGRSMNDSSFIMRAIEERYPARTATPSAEEDPVFRFVALLLEDFADDWLVRCVYGFRWNAPDVRQFSGQLLGATNFGGGELATNFAKFVVPRQLGTDNRSDAFVEGAYTDDIIYPTFSRVATVMEAHFSKPHRFMSGAAPSNVDFAFYGHFYQFIQDKIPRALMAERFPLTTAWVNRMHDTSGFGESVPEVTELMVELLRIAGQSHLPFMKANSDELTGNPESTEMVSVEILADSLDEPVVHRQRPYGYQAKCLDWLKEDLSISLDSANTDQEKQLYKLLESTGCLGYLT